MNRIIIFIGLLAWCVCPLRAQEKEVKEGHVTVGGYALIDMHPASGIVSGAAVMGTYERPLVDMRLGAELTLTNRIAVDFQCSVDLREFKNGLLYGKNRYLYRQFPRLDRQEFTGALELGWRGRHLNWEVGLCNRYTAKLVLRREGGMETVFEPMCPMFAVEGWLKDEHSEVVVPEWNVGVRWSSYNDFQIERVTNWTYSVKGYYQSDDKLRLTMEAGIHPVGALNLTATYDGWFAHVGAVYAF